jgi:hypothetical protein
MNMRMFTSANSFLRLEFFRPRKTEEEQGQSETGTKRKERTMRPNFDSSERWTDSRRTTLNRKAMNGDIYREENNWYHVGI